MDSEFPCTEHSASLQANKQWMLIFKQLSCSAVLSEYSEMAGALARNSSLQVKKELLQFTQEKQPQRQRYEPQRPAAAGNDLRGSKSPSYRHRALQAVGSSRPKYHDYW